METFETLDQLLRLGPEFGLRFLTAILCGGAIGMERETTGKPAGLRTCILVCIGSMLFTVMSIELGEIFGGDGTRIAAQIVTGIGFLGAGVILRERTGGVKGVTTAAIIWLMAALGMMIGAGYLISATTVTAAIVIMVLSLRRVERYIHLRQARDYCFVADDNYNVRDQIADIVGDYEDNLHRFSILEGDRPGKLMITFRFTGADSERRELLRSLYQIRGMHRAEHPNEDRESSGSLPSGESDD